MMEIKSGWRGFAAIVAAIGMAGAAGAATLNVKTAEEATAAAGKAVAGDEIVLADGEFASLKLKLEGKGEEGKPITLRAENKGGAVVNGSPEILITGDYVTVQGLAFKDCKFTTGTRGAVIFDGSGNSRLTDCSFENSAMAGTTALVYFRNGAHDNRLDNSQFKNIRYRSVCVVVDDDSLKNGPPVRNRIDHNLFQDVPPFNANGAETIQIGQRAIPHSDMRPETLVEENEFVRCDGEAEIISVKTSGNVIRNNTFRDNVGELVMRHGHSNTVTGNSFEGGSGGIRLSGHAHVVTGNTMKGCEGTGIRMYYGTPDLKHPASYLPVYDCVVEGNTIEDCGQAGIYIGDSKNARHENAKWAGPPWFGNAVMEQTVAPYNNRIVNNTVTGKAGKLIVVDDAPKNVIENNTLTEKP